MAVYIRNEELRAIRDDLQALDIPISGDAPYDPDKLAMRRVIMVLAEHVRALAWHIDQLRVVDED